jgi:hypothetical protein
MNRPANSRNNDSRRASESRVDGLLRAGAASRIAEGTGRLRPDVIRAIRAGARSEESHAGVLHGARHWWGVGGALAAALVALAVMVGQPQAPALRHPGGIAQTNPPLRLDPSSTPRLVTASATLAQKPLQDEARRLRADVTRGLNFLRSTVTLARSK